MIQSAIKEAKEDSVGEVTAAAQLRVGMDGLHAAQMQVKGGLLTRACLCAVTSCVAGYQHLSREGRGASLRTVR